MESTNNVTEQNICYILRKQHIIFYLRYVECENRVFFDYATLLLFVE